MKNSPLGCEPFRKRMIEAATADGAPAERADFDSHVHRCANCREEWGRVEALLKAMDRAVEREADVRPSEALFQKARQRIAEEKAAAEKTKPLRWIPAAACAAIVLLIASVWIVRPRVGLRGKMIRPEPMVSNHSSAKPPAVAPQNENKILAVHAKGKSKPAVVAERHRPGREAIRKGSEPEVLVPPGQMKALMKLVALLSQPNEHNAASVIEALKESNVDKPLKIRPLVIPSLETRGKGAAAGEAGRESSN